MVIIILAALLAIAGTVIYYEKKMTKEKSAEETATNTEEQTPGPDTSGTTTPADNTADNPTSSEINITLPNIKPGGAPKTIGLPIGGIKAPQPVKYIYIFNDALDPQTLEVTAGTKVIWQNKQWIAHLLIDRAGDFQSGLLGQADEYSYLFAKPGTHEYYDYYNKTLTGKIIVK